VHCLEEEGAVVAEAAGAVVAEVGAEAAGVELLVLEPLGVLLQIRPLITRS
jgi:hypothetical protein